jgi:hypothetical protein
MALGVLWYARMPATSTPWHLEPQSPSTFLPPLSYFTDLLPGGIIFGLGLCMLVAPLTTALMRSVPAHNAGLGSAINNAISRVGPQLAGALVFVFITASFYSYIAARRPDINVNDPAFRKMVSPLNPSGLAPMTNLVRDASTTSFHLAILVGAALLILGAIVNAIGIQDPGKAAAREVAKGTAEPAKEGT